MQASLTHVNDMASKHIAGCTQTIKFAGVEFSSNVEHLNVEAGNLLQSIHSRAVVLL
jgi:hypothetical protein